ncbi:MAG TPA: SurA N-terminal domain-containing protein [Candidatus Binataceae bacterium]|nr:SurA N-terminal domain-containing protein [Candidatus Binataceae bacterium]
MIRPMLAAMRKHAYSWGIRVLLGVITAIFVFWGVGSGFFAQIHPIATVNHRQILADQVNQASDRLRARMQQIYGENTELVLKGVNLREQALEMLIDQQLIDAEAARIGLRISNAMLEQNIASEPAFQLDGHFDFDTYERVLRNNNLLPSEFESEQRTSLLSQMMQKMVGDGVQVSDAEARRAFDLQNEVVSLSYFEVPYDRYIAAVHPTPAQIARYYKDHAEDFREPDRIKITYVYYDPMKLAAAAPLREVDIQDYYGDNQKTLFSHPEEVRVRHILIAAGKDSSPAEQAAARSKAEKLLDQIRHGADFAKLARADSDDLATRSSGGDLGFFARGQMIKPFEDAAFALKPGQTTMVRTQFGFHIIQLEAIKPAHTDTLAEARPAIVAALKQKAGADLARRALEQDLSSVLSGKTLKQVASPRGLPVVDTSYFAADDHPSVIGSDPNLMREAFKMQKGDIRAITGAKATYLVKLVDRDPSHIPPLKQIEERVSDALVRATAELQASALAEKLSAQIKSVEDFKRVAEKNSFEVYTTPAFPRSSGSVPGIGDFREVTDAAGLVPKVPGIIDHAMEHEGNSYLFTLVSRSFPADSDWQAAAPDFKKQLLEARRAQAWSSFLDTLRSHAEIAIDTNQLGPSTSSPM